MSGHHHELEHDAAEAGGRAYSAADDLAGLFDRNWRDWEGAPLAMIEQWREQMEDMAAEVPRVLGEPRAMFHGGLVSRQIAESARRRAEA